MSKVEKQRYCLLTLLRNIFLWLISMISNYKASIKTVPQYIDFTDIEGSDQEAIKRLNFCYPYLPLCK